MTITYWVRTCGDRVLHPSFKQIDYKLLVDANRQFINIFPAQLQQAASGQSDGGIVLMEDDIILCKNFKERIEAVINERPDEIINFFTFPMDLFHSGEVEGKDQVNYFCYNQCTYIPLTYIPIFIQEINKILAGPRPKRCTPETTMKATIQSLNIPHYRYRPCLVQHIDDKSLIGNNVRCDRRSPYFIDYIDELNESGEFSFKYEDLVDHPEQHEAILRKLLEKMYDQFKDIDVKIGRYNSSDIDFFLDRIIKKQPTFKVRIQQNRPPRPAGLPNVLIVGYGVVGHNLANEIRVLQPDIFDKFKPQFNTKRNIVYDFAFICVDTPFNEKGDCDLSAVRDAIRETSANIIIIKSTILPGTTEELRNEFKRPIIFSPEYYGGTQHCNNFDFNFTILGGEKSYCRKVQQLLQRVYDARHTFRIVDSKTAELTKYMENSYLAMKVAFCTQFYEIAQQLGVDYEDLRELFILDPRINESHTFVYDDHPYYQSHCLDKDVPAIANKMNAKLLKAIIAWNSIQKNKYKK